MSYTIRKQFRFEAAHLLEGHDGKCARLHGHSWVLIVEFTGVGLHGHGPKEGMLVDFGDVSAAVKPVVDEFLDHHYLNETLECARPTSEFVAEWLFDYLRLYIRRHQGLVMATLSAVTVEETCTSACTFRRD